jgi:hypothetical protein
MIFSNLQEVEWKELPDFADVLKSEDEVRELIGHPTELVRNKTMDRLDAHSRAFIALSPLLFISTSDRDGFCDVSPRGDAPGFVHVIDDKRLVIPDRPGNRRIDSIRNILANPKAGLIFIIPGLEETLRVNGTACITTDSTLMKQMEAHGKIPLLGIGIVVEEVYVHCAKAFKRSRLWDSASWPDRQQLPNAARMIAAHAKQLQLSEQEVASYLEESYTQRLY